MPDTGQAELPLVRRITGFPAVWWKCDGAATEQHLPWVGTAAHNTQQEKVRPVTCRDSPAASRILQNACQPQQIGSRHLVLFLLPLTGLPQLANTISDEDTPARAQEEQGVPKTSGFVFQNTPPPMLLDVQQTSDLHCL